MVRWIVAGVAVSLLSVIFINGSRMAAAAPDDIEKIMKKLHKGTKAVHKGIEKISMKEISPGLKFKN